MAPLKNVRHERYVQALFEGKPASTAYEEAGYVANDGNAIRLKGNEKVQARLRELQETVAKETKVTVESICKELDAANEVARAKGQAAAMVSASALRAKLAGLLTERVEIGAPGAFDKATSIAEIADEMILYELPPHAEVTTQDRQGLIDLLHQHLSASAEYLAAIKARPINPEIAYKARRIELKANSFRRIGR
jgi:hypothetical protein